MTTAVLTTPGQGTLVTGAQAEAMAACFLEARGLHAVERNFRCRAGEIDLIMRDGAVLVFVEVRFRTRPTPVGPALSVSATKQRRLLRAAALFLQGHRKYRGHGVRFDVLAMTGPLDQPRYEWIRCAFSADDVGGF